MDAYTASGGCNPTSNPCISGSPHDFTAVVWNKPSDTTGRFLVTSNASSATPRSFQFYTAATTNALHFTMFNSGGGNFADLAGSAGMSTGSWHMAAVVVTGASFKAQFYVDGTADTSTTTTSGTCNNEQLLQVGARADTGVITWNGSLDEISLFDTALSAANITTLWTDGSTAPPSTVLHHRFFQSRRDDLRPWSPAEWFVAIRGFEPRTGVEPW